MADGALEFLLKLDAQVDGALKMVRVLTQTQTGLGQAEAAILKTEKATVRAGAGHQKHAKDAKNLEGVLHRLVHSGMEPFLERAKRIAEFEFIRRGIDALIEAPERLIEKMVELGAEILNVAAATEALEKSFSFALGEERGKETLEWADRLAKVTNYTDDEIKNQALSLAKVGLEGQKLEDAMRGALDIAALSPDRIGGLQDAVSALARLARTGTVNNRTLAGLGIGEKDFAKLDSFKGKSRKEISKMMTDGKVTEAEVYKLITLKTGMALGGAAAAMGDTLQASLLHLKSLPEQYFQKFAHSPALEIMKDKLAEVLAVLDPDSPRGARIFSAMEGAVLKIVNMIAGIDFAGWADTVENKLIPGLQGAWETIKAIGIVLEPVIDALKIAAGLIHDLTPLGYIWDKAKETGQIENRNAELLRKINRVAPVNPTGDDESPAWLKKTVKLGKDAAAGAARGISADRSVQAASRNLGQDGMIDPLKQVLKIQSPSRVFQNIGAQAAAGMALGLSSGQGPVEQATMDIVQMPASSGAGGRAPVSVQVGGITIEVHVGGGGDAHAAGDEIADRISEILPAKLAAALEKIAIEMGAGGVQ
jgi:hypothetical protein